MKLFSRLFSKAAPAPTLDERKASLAAATPEVVLATALGDGDKDLRIAAIRMLPDGDDLRHLAGVSPRPGGSEGAISTSVKRAARTRMAELIDEGALDFAEFQAAVGSRNEMFSVAVLCQDPELLPRALASINDSTRLAQLVVDGPSSRLRQLAAQALDDPAQLKQLLKQARSRDGAVYQILKDKCAALPEDRKPAASSGGIEIADAQFRPIGPQAAVQAAEDARGRAQRVVQQAVEHAAEEARQAAEEARGRAQRVVQQAVEHAAEEARRPAQAAAQPAGPQPTEAQAELRRAAAAVQRAAEIVREEQVLLNQLAELISKADDALGSGNTRKAAILSRAIGERWPVPPAEPADPSRQLQQLDEELNSLGDEKEPLEVRAPGEIAALFGSSEDPGVGKRREVLERRRALLQRLSDFEARQTGDQLDWRQLARMVREAPQEWRQTASADGPADQDLQEKFDAVMARLQARFDAWYERTTI